MKYCIVIPDGAADSAVPCLGDLTPLQAAHTPNMDRAARKGMIGLVNHVPAHMTPGSSVAMMSVVGYDPAHNYTGRGPIEAADMGIRMKPGDWAVRCNLVTVCDGNLVDFTAGHISTEEAGSLIEALNAGLGSAQVVFHLGTQYRHVMTYRGVVPLAAETVPPHDVVGQPLAECYPHGEGAEFLIGRMEASRSILQAHPVNLARVAQGKNPANMIWLWGQGLRPVLKSFEARFGLKGAVISAVNLVRGIGRLIGWDVVEVPGITAYTDTDYAAKGRYAAAALETHDLVLVHVEAPDEASHERDVQAKVGAIERIDADIVGPLMACRQTLDGLRLLIMPDHITAVADGKHKRGAVPFAMWGDGVRAASGVPYTEGHADASDVSLEHGHELMGEFIGRG